MAENFYTMLTIVGKNKLSSSAVSGSKVNFKTLKVGDGKGAYYEPSENQTSLVNEVWEGNISSISIDENNSNWIVVETVIPASDGGFFIREAGIFDEDGDMIAISKLAETYKPVVAEGSTKDLVIRIVLEVLNVDTVTIKIDPNVVAATKNDVQVLEAKFEDVSAQLSDLAKSISNDAVLTPSVDYGMNNVIKNDGETSIQPKFNIQGKTVINLLGKDGNCEDVSKWSTAHATATLDPSNKMYGSNSIKLTSTTTTDWGAGITITTPVLDTSKYYMYSAWIKNGSGASGCGLFVEGLAKTSIAVTDTTKFTRIGILLSPSEISSITRFQFNVFTGVVGSYGYFDGIQLNEILSTDYTNGVDYCLTKYPYVDSYTCLQNPYIEVRHDNLVRNGNGEEGVSWWTPNNSPTSLTIGSERKFNLVTSAQWQGELQNIKLKSNTDYYITGNVSNLMCAVQSKDFNTVLLSARNGSISATFNSGNITDAVIIIQNISTSAVTGTYDHIMLVEGTTAPTQYLPCRIERVVLETKLTSDDSITYENGEVTGLINWKHKTLYGKDYDWQFAFDETGAKAITLSHTNSSISGIAFSEKVVKYDGSIIQHQNTFDTNSKDVSTLDGNNDVYLALKDSDTGWTETINPNNDEVKAFMNGWKAINGIWSYNNNRYVIWTSIMDGSYPPIVPQSTVASAYTSGSSTLVVSDGSKFYANQHILLVGSGGFAVVQSVNGNTLTLSVACGLNTASGTLIVGCDDGSSDLKILNYCKNNTASNYDGYQLHYKLASPESITDDNCHIHGDIPKFDVGDNYLFLDSGGVIGELENVDSSGGMWAYLIDGGSNTPKSKYKLEQITAICKNSIWNTNDWTINSQYPWGNCRVYMAISSGKFDSSATYTVDYKILATIAPQVGSIGCSYSQDISTAINDLQEEINNRQEHDSIFDEIVDLSMYEVISTINWSQALILPWCTIGTALYVDFTLNMSQKKSVPTITVNKYNLSSNGTDVTSKFVIQGIVVNKTMVNIQVVVNDSATVSSIKTNGIYGQISITADCRGRI